MNETGFNYKLILGMCQHKSHIGIADCNNPACYRVWWTVYHNGINVCEHHFRLLKIKDEIKAKEIRIGKALAKADKELEDERTHDN